MVKYSRLSSTASASSKSDGTASKSRYSKDHLVEIAHALKRNVEVRDRKFRLKTYDDCFMGTECIDFLQNYMQFSKRKDAVRLALQMNEVLHFCEHVKNEHKIKDEPLFYRFTDFAGEHQLTLLQVMRAFQRGMPTEDRTYRLRAYQNVFVGSEAVDWLVEYKFAPSRAHAVELGNKLAEEYELFVHVTNEHPLKDEYIFYRMLVPQNMPGQTDLNSKVKLDKKALQAWVAVFSVIGMAIYYYVF